MATIIRSALSGSDWTHNTLASYNIIIEYVDTNTFFGRDLLERPTIANNELWMYQDAEQMSTTTNCKLINLLDLLMHPPTNHESHVDTFALSLFESLGYVMRTRVAVAQINLPLWICGENKNAQTDICLMDRMQNNLVLLIQEDKGLVGDSANAEAQLVAEVIAVFQFNNSRRLDANRPVLSEKVMAGIIMVGTSPYFCKIPITNTLCSNIRFGEYPAKQTVVRAHIPEIPRPNCCVSEGMKPSDNRCHLLRCYEAFKKFVN